MKAASIHQLYFLWCVKTLCPRFGPRCIISLLWAAWHATQTWLVVCSEDHLQFQELQGLPFDEACHYTVTWKKSVELLQKNIKKNPHCCEMHASHSSERTEMRTKKQFSTSLAVGTISNPALEYGCGLGPSPGEEMRPREAQRPQPAMFFCVTSLAVDGWEHLL